jgi:hypothetical protein
LTSLSVQCPLKSSEKLVGHPKFLICFDLCGENISIGHKKIFQHFQHWIIPGPRQEAVAIFFRNHRTVHLPLTGFQIQQLLDTYN